MQANNNLRIFSLLFLIKGILTLCFSLFFMIYVGLGFFVTSVVELNQDNNIPFNPGVFIIIIGGIGLVLSVTIGILTILASNYLKAVKNYNFIFIVIRYLSIVNVVSYFFVLGNKW